MRKFLILAILLLSAPALAYEDWQARATLTGGVVADNTTVTITLPEGVGTGAWMSLPSMTSSTYTIQGSLDGTNFGNLYYYTSGANPVYTQISTGTAGPLMIQLPDIRQMRKIKLTCATAQVADRLIIVFGKRREN